MLKIGILGAGGRMGQMIAHEIKTGKHSASIGAEIDVGGDKESAFKACDVLIDFTSPEGVEEHAALSHQYKKPLVVGTTGLSPVEEAALKAAAKTTSIFYTANMSMGVNLLVALVEQAAAKLNAEFDIEIFEAHHCNKVDAPSGTALLLGRSAAKGRGVKLEDAKVIHTPSVGARISGSIGFSVFRGGDAVGDHTVTFAGMGERIELTHKASDRAIFAKGAVKAALWIKNQKPGLYSMRDMLGI